MMINKFLSSSSTTTSTTSSSISTILRGSSFPSISWTSLVLQSACLSYGLLIAINLRWKYLGDTMMSLIGKRKPKSLPIIKVIAKNDNDNDIDEKTKTKNDDEQTKKKLPIIVLLHGMWHDASWCLFEDLQVLLQQHGYTSYSIDLLPGKRFLPGFTQTDIVNDIEYTLEQQKDNDNDNDNDNGEYILVGHSQGGLVVQSLLLHASEQFKSKIKGLVLMGTYPLSLIPPMSKIMKESTNMYTHYGYLGITCLGKIINTSYLKHIFFMPTTNQSDTKRLKAYTQTILNAPSDGYITMSHFLTTKLEKNGQQQVVPISTKPTLVLGAEKDIIYFPHLFKDDFNLRFPNSTHKIIPNQAHCFMDPIMIVDEDNEGGTGGQQMNNIDHDVKHVLVDWIDEILT